MHFRLFRRLMLALFMLAAPLAQASSGYAHDGALAGAGNPDWMRALPDQRWLAELSLPGTHDTMAFYGGDSVQTQSLPLSEQLRMGIRVIDIRCRRVSNRFLIHHGPIYQFANFDDVLGTLVSFLHAHPSEVVLMRLRQDEWTPLNSSLSYAAVLQRYMADPRYRQYFWTGQHSQPKLGDVRGKIVILRNFEGDVPGIDYEAIDRQDQYQLDTNWDLYDKWRAVRAQLVKAGSANHSSGTFYMNYLSGSGGAFPYFVASGHSSPGTGAPRLLTGLTTPLFASSYPDFPRVGCLGPLCSIAFEGTNALTSAYLAREKPAYAGIVMMDFPGPDLVRQLIALNPPASVVQLQHAGDGASLPLSFDIGSYARLDGMQAAADGYALRVPPGYRVTVYQQPEFGGPAATLAADARLPDAVGSMQVESAAIVTLYTGAQYAAASHPLKAGHYRMVDLPAGSEHIASARVLPGWQLTVYAGAEFSGAAYRITADTPALAGGALHAASLIVERR